MLLLPTPEGELGTDRRTTVCSMSRQRLKSAHRGVAIQEAKSPVHPARVEGIRVGFVSGSKNRLQIGGRYGITNPSEAALLLHLAGALHECG